VYTYNIVRERVKCGSFVAAEIAKYYCIAGHEARTKRYAEAHKVNTSPIIKMGYALH